MKEKMEGVCCGKPPSVFELWLLGFGRGGFRLRTCTRDFGRDWRRVAKFGFSSNMNLAI